MVRIYVEGSGGVSTHSIFLLDIVGLFVFLMFQSENSPTCITKIRKLNMGKSWDLLKSQEIFTKRHSVSEMRVNVTMKEKCPRIIKVDPDDHIALVGNLD